MTFIEYTEGSLRTESTLCPITQEVEARGISNRLYHAIVGIQTEINEIYDAIELVRPEDFDNVNILEECGDIQWYIAIAADDLKITKDISDFLYDDPILTNQEICDPFTKYVFLKNIRQISSSMLDLTKKTLFYGKEFDLESAKQAIVTQFMMVKAFVYLISQDESTFDSVLHINLAKLKQRYPEKFDGYKAEIRDLESERKILEKI